MYPQRVSKRVNPRYSSSCGVKIMPYFPGSVTIQALLQLFTVVWVVTLFLAIGANSPLSAQEIDELQFRR